ncbi:hypothetical protein [Halorarum halobium]|uniref:hypothetical protein n=1 Tax=Halorarum halobium TaxID=3075121 RepID=UPI0028ABE3B7|nr:hypothetical protein [Halobaculum sp. XH14]
MSVSVETPPEVERDRRMEFRVELRNWLPVPITVPTTVRPWYWQLDGVHDADATEPDPDGSLSEAGGSLSFSAFERKEITRIWNGRIRATESAPFLPVDPGTHTLGVEVTATAGPRPSARREFEIVPETGGGSEQ